MLAGCQTIFKRKLDLFAITGVHTSTEGRPYLATTFYFRLADIYRGDIASFPDSLVCVQYEPHGKWRGGGGESGGLYHVKDVIGTYIERT